MKPEQIVEGRCYLNSRRPHYFRQVEMIVDAGTRSGGKLVAWSTDGFAVASGNGGSGGPSHGKCSLETFAGWATAAME